MILISPEGMSCYCPDPNQIKVLQKKGYRVAPDPVATVKQEDTDDSAPLVDPGVINLNTAEVDELTAQLGIKIATAKAIVAGRPYESLEDLSKVSGVNVAALVGKAIV